MKNKKIINFLLLLLLSILVYVYIFGFIGNKMDTLGGYENEYTSPTADTIKELAIYTVPIFPIYLIGCIYLLKKGMKLKYLAYPIILITFITIITTIGVCYNGAVFKQDVALLLLVFFHIPFTATIIIGVLQETVWSKDNSKA